MQTNELRGLLYEFGIVLAEGHRALLKELPAAVLEAQCRLPSMLIDCLDGQVRRINQLEDDIGTIEGRLSQQMRDTPACKSVAEIPGVELMTATAIVASMGSPAAFKDAREFAAGSGWCRGEPARAVVCGNWASANAARVPANLADARCSRDRLFGHSKGLGLAGRAIEAQGPTAWS